MALGAAELSQKCHKTFTIYHAFLRTLLATCCLTSCATISPFLSPRPFPRPSLSVVIYTCSRRESVVQLLWLLQSMVRLSGKSSVGKLASTGSISRPFPPLHPFHTSLLSRSCSGRRTRCVCVIFDALKPFGWAPVVFAFARFRPGPNKKIFKIYRFILLLRIVPLCVYVFFVWVKLFIVQLLLLRRGRALNNLLLNWWNKFSNTLIPVY